MNLIFISHCDFTGNSAMHLFSIANELHRQGVASVVCVPNKPETIHLHGRADFGVMDYHQAETEGVRFPDDRGPDLIHAWTPRESVRRLTEILSRRHACPFLVHLEDNEEAILADDFPDARYDELSSLPARMLDLVVPAHRSHPVRYREFLSRAVGVTALMDRLLEFKPEGIPGIVFWPGFENAFVQDVQAPEALRRRIAKAPGEKVVAYTGNIHNSNVAEVRSLYLAIAALRRRRIPVKLVKTGWNYADPWWPGSEGQRDLLVDLGFLPRHEVPALLTLADVLVQPGCPNRFNDYRFPSKLPEFLASGKPVVLPRTNIGRFLRDGEEAVLLHRGSALEIAEKLGPLLADARARDRIGRAGRDFALRELTWKANVTKLKRLYNQLVEEPVDREGGPRRATAAISASVERLLPLRLLAFYLPQFHPTPENDAWWGKGFTEWTGVSRARPNFTGHVQPRLPADLGFYDLRVPEVMDEQAAMAQRYGLGGFCFYYYWFDGRRLLDRPLDQWLRRGRPNFPFCICWANENWSRRWDGSDSEILMEQTYAPGWEDRFIQDVLPFLMDRRYIRVGGEPLLLVYRVANVPQPSRVADRWREVCRAEGLGDVHLCAVQSFGIGDPRPYGFDSAVEFVPPHIHRQLIDPKGWPGIHADFRGYLESYPAVMRRCLALSPPDYPWYRGANPSWDNTPRRGNRAHILVESSPELYEEWLRNIVEQTLRRAPAQEPLVFINAWNEWAEGAILEPDQQNGHAYLQATRRAACTAVANHYRQRGLAVDARLLEQALEASLTLAPRVDGGTGSGLAAKAGGDR